MLVSFKYPLYLNLLFLIPIIIFLHFYGLKNLRGKALKFANFDAIAKVKGIDLYSKNLNALILNIIIFSLLIFVISGITIYKELDSSSFSYTIAIDTSESMTAKDLNPNRLEAAKRVAIEFIKSLPPESYVAVLSFSGDSKIEQELTKDKTLLENSIKKIDFSTTAGTDIYEAVINSINLIEKEKYKAIILFSDGQINVGDLTETIKIAKEKQTIIHTIGVGTIVGGETTFGISKLDENSLKSIAYNTNGKYFLMDSEEGIKNALKGIIEYTKKEAQIDISPYLLFLILILLLFKWFLISTNRIIW